MEGAYRRGILASFVARSPSRVVLAAIAPSLDLLAVSAAVAIVGAINAFGLISMAIIVAAVNTRGRPTARLHPRVADDVGWLLGSVALLMLLVLPLARSSAALDGLVLLGPLAFALLVVGRTVSYACIRSLREGGTALEPTVIVGAGAVGVEVAFILKAHPEFGLLPIGFLDVPGRDDLPLPLLGDSIDLSDIVRDDGIRKVVVAFGGRPEGDLVDVLRACDDLPVDIYALPRFFEEGFGSSGAFEDEVWGLPLQRLRRTPFRRVGRYVKRGFDIAVAGVALVLTSPLMAIGAVAVRLSGAGPILFRQTRLGVHGREFQIFKFRTMIPNENSDTTWYADDDDRLTRVGRLLRRTSIDELPQLFNVLRGDMSIVGPRPERTSLRSSVLQGGSSFRRSSAPASRRHRLGAGPRTGRGLDPREGAVRQLLHRALVPLARYRDASADDQTGVPRGGCGAHRSYPSCRIRGHSSQSSG